ncbi:MAG: hypothetical protein AAF488_15465, partial [Planctomycetota bacterium]
MPAIASPLKLSALVLLFSSTTASFAENLPLAQIESKLVDAVERVLPSTVTIRGRGSGSGVIVSKDGIV